MHWGQWMSLHNILALHQMVVEISLSETKWWTNCTTPRAVPVCLCVCSPVSTLVIFSIKALFPSPACIYQSATSTRPEKWHLIRLTRHPPLPLHTSCEQLDLVVRMRSDSRAGRPLSALLPPTVCTCDATRHVTAACLGVRAQQPADHHHRRLLLFVPNPWSRWVFIKLHLTLSLQQAQLITNLSARLCSVKFYHLFSSDLPSQPPSSLFYLTGSPLLTGTDEPVTLSCPAVWWMRHWGSGLQSVHVLFFFLQQHQPGLNISDLWLWFTAEADCIHI